VVEDDHIVRNSLAKFLNANGFRTRGFKDAEEFIENLSWSPPINVIIIDVQLPGMSGMDLMAWLKKNRIGVPVFVMTGKGDIATAVAAMKAGATEFIEKPVSPDQILSLIQALGVDLERSATVDHGREDVALKFNKLTPRQRVVLEMVCDGLTSKEIALKLSTSHRTVEAHRAAIMARLGASSLAELVHIWIRERDRLP
jgi:two-component system response regulator FixJ